MLTVILLADFSGGIFGRRHSPDQEATSGARPTTVAIPATVAQAKTREISVCAFGQHQIIQYLTQLSLCEVIMRVLSGLQGDMAIFGKIFLEPSSIGAVGRAHSELNLPGAINNSF